MTNAEDLEGRVAKLEKARVTAADNAWLEAEKGRLVAHVVTLLKQWDAAPAVAPSPEWVPFLANLETLRSLVGGSHFMHGTCETCDPTAAQDVLRQCRTQLCTVEDELRGAREHIAALTETPDPTPLILLCPQCHARHIDRGEFATKVHTTHACQACGAVWRPAVVATVGVQYLPGFKDPES